MAKKTLVILLLIVVILVIAVFFVSNNGELSAAEIMQMIKTDKDYNDLSSFIKGFDPEITNYMKLGPSEYQKIKPQWQKQGFSDRITAIDKITLTDSTYWIELKDKKDQTKGLLTILDVKAKKSLLLIASLSIKAGIGI